MSTQNDIKQYMKWAIILILHVVGAFLTAYLLVLALTYGNVIGDLGLEGLFFLWTALGSYVLPATILILSLLVVFLINPIQALICLILVFFSTALFLLSINVNFLAMIYLIIYIGAIAILFLFVIMMFNLQELHTQSVKVGNSKTWYFHFSFCLAFLQTFYALLNDAIFNYVEFDKYFGNFVRTKFNSLRYFLTYQHTDILLFGTLLYDYYSYLFLLAALILLTSMLGSIVLALSTTEDISKN